MTGRGLLISELERVVKNCCRIFGLIKTEDLGWSATDDMQSIGDACNYVAQIPGVDLRILKGREEKEIEDYERRLKTDEPAHWVKAMQEGCDELIHYMEHLSFDEYENGIGTAYYGRSQSNNRWLVEILMNIYHHRAMLWTMLKLKGYSVDMRTLYE